MREALFTVILGVLLAIGITLTILTWQECWDEGHSWYYCLSLVNR